MREQPHGPQLCPSYLTCAGKLIQSWFILHIYTQMVPKFRFLLLHCILTQIHKRILDVSVWPSCRHLRVCEDKNYALDFPAQSCSFHSQATAIHSVPQTKIIAGLLSPPAPPQPINKQVSAILPLNILQAAHFFSSALLTSQWEALFSAV